MLKSIIFSLAFSKGVAESAASPKDLRRARQPKPGQAFRGDSFASTNQKLNDALRSTGGLQLVACEELSDVGLRQAMLTLLSARQPALDTIYQSKGDARKLPHMSPEHWADEWTATSLSVHAKAAHEAKCHEAVMLWIHHVAEGSRANLLSRLVLPLLPETSERLFSESDLHLHGKDAAVAAYVRATTCAICHSNDGPAEPAGAPVWPPPVAPVWPTQFTSPVTGFDNATTPQNFTGMFYYDWPNNLLRYDSVPIAGNDLGAEPLTNSSRIFVGLPRPDPDPVSDLSAGIYQFTWGSPSSCVHFPMPGESIERPDSMAHVNATRRDRVQMEGHWTDFWYWWFDDTTTKPLEVHEAFQMWVDIKTNYPVKLYGPLSPNFDPTVWGATVWHKVSPGVVDLGAWTSLDYSICNKAQGLPAVGSLHEFVHAGKHINKATQLVV